MKNLIIFVIISAIIVGPVVVIGIEQKKRLNPHHDTNSNAPAMGASYYVRGDHKWHIDTLKK